MALWCDVLCALAPLMMAPNSHMCTCAGVRCWSFCPPGGLLSTNLSAAVAPFVTSVVVGKDVVPRISIVNLGRLIDEMARSTAC